MDSIKWFLSYNGRIGRLRFFFFNFTAQIITAVFILASLFILNEYGGNTLIFLYLCCIGFLLYATSCLVAKRFHDINKSAWNVLWWYPIGVFSVIQGMNTFSSFLDEDSIMYNILLLTIFPLAIILSIILLFRKGTAGLNKYGPERNKINFIPHGEGENNTEASKAMFCHKCDAQLEEDSIFCSHCATRISL